MFRMELLLLGGVGVDISRQDSDLESVEIRRLWCPGGDSGTCLPRKFVPPALKFQAETPTELIDWGTTSLTKPVLTVFHSEELQACKDAPLWVPETWQCHLQGIEREVTNVSEACQGVVDQWKQPNLIWCSKVSSRTSVGWKQRQTYWPSLTWEWGTTWSQILAIGPTGPSCQVQRTVRTTQYSWCSAETWCLCCSLYVFYEFSVDFGDIFRILATLSGKWLKITIRVFVDNFQMERARAKIRTPSCSSRRDASKYECFDLDMPRSKFDLGSRDLRSNFEFGQNS